MDIQQISYKYLNTLYLKSLDNFDKGYSEKVITKLNGLDGTQAHNVMKYLSGKGLVDTTSGFGDNISLTPDGIDIVDKLREGKIFKLLRFTGAQYVPSTRDAIEFVFYYQLMDVDKTNIEEKAIRVMVSGSLSICWGFQIWQSSTNYTDLEKILLQFGKDRVIEKVKEGTITEYEEMLLTTSHYPTERPFNPEILIETKFAEYEIEVGEKMLSEEIKENKLAAAIIESRDTINAIFHSKHGEKLLQLNEERNLLDFFKTAKSEEEFSHRISSLAEVSRNLNIKVLRKLTNETDTKLGSVALLDKLLTSLGIQEKSTTEILRNIGRVRQGYPVHTDISGVIQGCKFFGLKYPVEDYENTWTSLLNFYLKSLKQLYEILADKYLVAENEKA
jgi:hypothetical protein